MRVAVVDVTDTRQNLESDMPAEVIEMGTEMMAAAEWLEFGQLER